MQNKQDIYKVDEAATRAAVEKYLLQAREYAITEYIPEEASVTASYSSMPRSNTNVTSDQTGEIASTNVDEPERRRQHVQRANQAINRLGARQRSLISMRYMDDDNVLDIDVACEMDMSPRHYRRIKSLALYRLATTLGLIVISDD
ncbi:ArpU family phage packaging/lysis transcriptional regulator [Paenibacillus daejeonensis]|uniref:ArpU family phage packaging/lysis transcriptional regulator n=1 Tax=Paenibacillus daejeonensis TaxID=135193 RepID=UPI000361504B|nr:ArpU family phage packaging/lysis transcriptional regulator [Paenibacillus daejeonensis]